MTASKMKNLGLVPWGEKNSPLFPGDLFGHS